MAKLKSLDKGGGVLTPEQKENRDLKKKLDALEKMVLQIQKSNISVINQNTEDIPLNKQVKVMSLCNNKLNLCTEDRGQGHRYSFERFGEIKKISYGDLLAINQRQRNFLEAGYYIILDDRIVEEEALAETYLHVLNKEKIEQILESKEGSLNLFQTANTKQQKIIVDMIVQKMTSGEYVDFNLINNIDRIYGQENPNYITIAERVRVNKEINDQRMKD